MRDNTGYRLFIPRSWERVPLPPYGYIIRDRIYDIAMSPSINYNAYYEPSYTRTVQIRKLSGRITIHREPRRILPTIATVHNLSQLRMQRHLDNIRSLKNRL